MNSPVLFSASEQYLSQFLARLKGLYRLDAWKKYTFYWNTTYQVYKFGSRSRTYHSYRDITLLPKNGGNLCFTLIAYITGRGFYWTFHPMTRNLCWNDLCWKPRTLFLQFSPHYKKKAGLYSGDFLKDSRPHFLKGWYLNIFFSISSSFLLWKLKAKYLANSIKHI